MTTPSGIDIAFNASPDLVNTPGLALDAASSLDATTFSPVLTHLTNVQQSTQAVADINAQDQTANDHGGGGGGIFHAIAHTFQSIPGIKSVEHGLGYVVKYASKPLQEIQKDYRFIHTVWTKNGPVAGFLATVGVVGGAYLGARAGIPEGALLGGEGVAEVERVLSEDGVFGSSLRDTAHIADDPKTKISIGRDIANGLGQIPGLHTLKNTDQGFGKVVSGAADASADWTLDPLVVASKLKTGLKLGEATTASKALAAQHISEGIAKDGKIRAAFQGLLSGDLLRTMQTDGSAKFFDRVAPGIQLRTTAAEGGSIPLNSEQLTNLFNAPSIAGIGAGVSYKRALKNIADLAQSGGSAAIIRRYPELEPLAANYLKAPFKAESGGVSLQAPIKGLGSVKTADEAHNVFVSVAENQNFADRLDSLSVLPTRTLTRAPLSTLADWAQRAVTTTAENETGLAQGLARTAKDFASGGGLGSLQALSGAIARKVRTFSGYLPYSLDKNTLELSSKSFSVDAATGRVSPLAATGILRSFSFSMGEQRARYWTNQFINAPNLAQQKRVWAEGNFELLKAAGLPNDNALVQNVRAQLADINTGPMGEPKNVYAVGAEKGTDAGLQPAGDAQIQAALWSHQASTSFSFPEFTILKQEMRKLNGAIDANYGKLDDLAARKFVQSVFKPLALLNAGFGFRVALAEAIPQAIRVGALKTLRDVVNTKAAKLDYKVNEGEDAHILAAAARALSEEDYAGPIYSGKRVQQAARRVLIAKGQSGLAGGINRLVNDPIARERAVDLIIRHQGHIAQGVARTGESTGGWMMDQDPSYKAKISAYTAASELKNHPQLKWAGSKDFDTFTPGEDVYDGYLHGALSRVSQERSAQLVSADLARLDRSEFEPRTRPDGELESPEEARRRALSPIVENEAQRIQDAIDNVPGALEGYVRDSQVLSAYDNIKAQNWTAQDFAANRVDALRGLTEGADGTVHMDILNKLAHGEKPAIEDIASIPKPSRPAQVYGPSRVPFIGPNPLQRIISQGFTKVIDPIINGLSRDPMYFNSYSAELDRLMPAVKSGTLDEETAQRIAETRAAVGILPKIHNTALRSQFAVLARNFMPFYFAQEQALRRAGRLVASNPGALRQFQLINHGLNDPGFVHKDDQGNRFFMFPHIGAFQEVGNGLLGLFGDSVQSGLPLTVQGSMSSLNTILPDFQQPGVSPIVSIPLNKLAALFPELSPQVKDIVGDQGFGQAALDALLPHPIVKAAWRVMSPDEKDASFANAVFTAMATSYYNGSAPTPNASDQEKAAWINRIKNNARSTFIVKGLLGLISPLAPQVSNQTEAESGFRTEFYNLVKKDGYAQALQTFLNEHGTKAISYTVAHSEPVVHGAYMPYTNDAVNWINSPVAQQLQHSPYAEGAAFLVPQAQGKGDIQTIHAEVIRNGLRTQDTPRQFLDAVDIAMGNNSISPAVALHSQALADAKGDAAATAAERQNWSEYVKVQELNNPTWYGYWASPARTELAFRSWWQLKQIFEGKAVDSSGHAIPVPTTPQAQIVQGLLGDYQKHAIEMSQLSKASARKAEKDNWSSYLQQTAANNPLAYSVINAVFARLDTAGVTPNGGTV